MNVPSSTNRAYFGFIIERQGPARGPRNLIKYKAVAQDSPGIQTVLVFPFNKIIVDEGSDEPPIVLAAKVNDLCVIQFIDGEQRLYTLTEALVSGPCEPPVVNPNPPVVGTTPVDPVRPIDDPVPGG